MIKTVTAIFDRLGLDYVAVGGPTYCCGIVHHQNGDTAASTGMNRRTKELFERYTPREVVMWCPSCIYFYDEVQKLDLPFPTRHTAEFLADRLGELPLSPVAARGLRCTATASARHAGARARPAAGCWPRCRASPW